MKGIHRRTTVLFVLHSLEVGGTERVMAHIVNHIDREFFRPILALGAAEGPYLGDLREDIDVHVLGHTRARTAAPALLSLIRRLRPDVVMSAGGLNLAVCLTRAGFPRATRVVLREANTASAFLDDVQRERPMLARVYRVAYRALYERADAVICQSRYMLDDLVQLGVPRMKLYCIYNPVDIDRVKTLALVGSPTLLRGSPALVTVGKLHYQKGYDVLVAAMSLLREQYGGVHVTVIGEGEERRPLEAQIEALTLQETVTLTGFQDNPYAAMAGADLFISSSRYEGFANVIAEAHALGTPVVATDCPSANREVIEPGVNGWLAPSEDAPGLAQSIAGALKVVPGINRTGIAARCEERFAARTVLRAYEHVLSGRETGNNVPSIP